VLERRFDDADAFGLLLALVFAAAGSAIEWALSVERLSI